MILLRKTTLTITALTVLLQLSCTPVFAEDTGRTTRASTDHSTRERVRVRVRVRREVHDHRNDSSDSKANTSEKTTSMDRETASSDRRDNARDSMSDRTESSRERATNNSRDANAGCSDRIGDSGFSAASAPSKDKSDSLSNGTTPHRRLVKRLVRVYLRTYSRNVAAASGYNKSSDVDTNMHVASINPSSVKQKGQLAPMNDLDRPTPYGHGVRGDINRGEQPSKGTTRNGNTVNDAKATLDSSITDLQNSPTARTNELSTNPTNNCAKRPNRCVTRPTDNGLTRLPSQPKYKTDQDEALAAVENGSIMPWKEAIKHLSRTVSGKIIGVRMNQTSERSVYQVKVRTPEGEIKSILVDAATGQILQTLGY